MAQKLREQQDLYLQQELQDLHQALMWAFKESDGQHSKLNCFSDQPTEHLQKLPESHQLTLMTYDLIDYNGQLEDARVHTILFKPSQQALGRLPKQRVEGKLAVLTRVKCTPQPEHIAEAIYLHHTKYLKNIATVHYIGEAAASQTNRPWTPGYSCPSSRAKPNWL